MSFAHNQLSNAITAELLRQIRAGQNPWLADAQLFSPATTYWPGFVDWPRPDGILEDASTSTTLAIEFKPPGHQKGEYVRGLGQAVTYLREFHFAVMVVPRLSSDRFPIADYLVATLKEQFASTLPVGVFAYEKGVSDLTSVLQVRTRQDQPSVNRPGGSRKVFWAYWRDLSQFDVLDIVVQMDVRQEDFNAAFQGFWDNQLSKGTARNWDGTTRTARSSSFTQEKLNSSLSLRHSGLVDTTGQLTEAGYNLSRTGRVYGASSVAFLRALSRQVLVHGRHLELIFWVEQQQRLIGAQHKRTRTAFLDALDDSLVNAGIIRPPQGTSKPNYVRDEPKLWNQLGLLQRVNRHQYFHTEHGLVFDWRAIISAVGD